MKAIASFSFLDLLQLSIWIRPSWMLSWLLLSVGMGEAWGSAIESGPDRSYDELRLLYGDSERQLQMIDLFEQKNARFRRASGASGILLLSGIVANSINSRQVRFFALLLFSATMVFGFLAALRGVRYRKSRLIEHLSKARPLPTWLEKKLPAG